MSGGIDHSVAAAGRGHDRDRLVPLLAPGDKRADVAPPPVAAQQHPARAQAPGARDLGRARHPLHSGAVGRRPRTHADRFGRDAARGDQRVGARKRRRTGVARREHSRERLHHVPGVCGGARRALAKPVGVGGARGADPVRDRAHRALVEAVDGRPEIGRRGVERAHTGRAARRRPHSRGHRRGRIARAKRRAVREFNLAVVDHDPDDLVRGRPERLSVGERQDRAASGLAGVPAGRASDERRAERDDPGLDLPAILEGVAVEFDGLRPDRADRERGDRLAVLCDRRRKAEDDSARLDAAQVEPRPGRPAVGDGRREDVGPSGGDAKDAAGVVEPLRPAAVEGNGPRLGSNGRGRKLGRPRRQGSDPPHHSPPTSRA